ncbi:MAG: undecaprenyl/decaprenyl-phosphate alpha-N-acetylglucosaminyl 1-phosphate transferase [Sedimentisphaerales bacterium]|nr:undecaprenyl/decaprenyl-phosphate alpha-N-acetylglucosaminyl 1-phosphate transferase [Sedimentisphaerales bacterium]MBN2842318.1 undecaprenyl/decaprenyl-phosphate alpha-N-acetylglucosaminyl 1-phosphate transferase [Sedimentisphaerales bacterium]
MFTKINATDLALILTAGIYALCAGSILTALVRKLAIRLNFTDSPGERKIHQRPIALGGGLALFITIIAPLALAALAAYCQPLAQIARHFFPQTDTALALFKANGIEYLTFLAVAALLHITGIIDDRKALGPYPKLIIQLGSALLLATMGGVCLDFFIASYPLRVLLSTLWIVIIVNAFNFLDNMDGLSAGIALICSLLIMTAALSSGQIYLACFLALIAGALLGFLFFNFNPASIFMGDAGSLLIGMFMATASIKTTYYQGDTGTPAHAAAMPLLILAVPLYDFISVVIIRLLQGRSPFVGDKQHFSHRLTDRGLTPRAAVLTIWLATALTGIGAIIIPQVNTIGLILIVAQTIMTLILIAILEFTQIKSLRSRETR